MQVNPNIEYNKEDAGLTLDKPDVAPVENVSSNDVQESSDAQDEVDLITAEQEQKKNQKNVKAEKKRVISVLEDFFQARKNDKYFTIGCMAAGVFSVVFVYFFAVFM